VDDLVQQNPVYKSAQTEAQQNAGPLRYRQSKSVHAHLTVGRNANLRSGKSWAGEPWPP
jgi:hypothetical protein